MFNNSHTLQNLSSFLSKICQTTTLLKINSSISKPRDYLLIVNSLINYIDESFVHTRILITTNESRYIPRHEHIINKLMY